MPYPFTLPTTSVLSFPLFLSSPTHPSLPLTATTHRNILRAALKRHKRLPLHQQPSHLSDVLTALQSYIPYLLAIKAGVSDRPITINGNSDETEEVDVILLREVESTWRCPLTAQSIPGRDGPRIKLKSLESEVLFTLSTLAAVYSLLARTELRPLYDVTSTGGAPSSEQRAAALTAAKKHLLDAHVVYNYMASRTTEYAHTHTSSLSSGASAADISHNTVSALAALTLAEANLTAISKDDPYAAAAAQERNLNDKEWMYKSPSMPKVRVSLFARCCVEAGEHAGKAGAAVLGQARSGGFASGLSAGLGKFRKSGKGEENSVAMPAAGKLDESFVKYVDDLHRTARARACRFLGVDAEMAGETGTAIAWLNGALSVLAGGSSGADGASSGSGESRKGFSRLKKEWTERREDKKVAKDTGEWGADAGRGEEVRVVEGLKTKWTKMNDTINTQLIPPHATLLTTALPSGREFIPKPKAYVPPSLDEQTLVSMRAPLDPEDEEIARRGGNGGADSSDEDDDHRPGKEPVGAFPGTAGEYGGGGGGSGNVYY